MHIFLRIREFSHLERWKTDVFYLMSFFLPHQQCVLRRRDNEDMYLFMPVPKRQNNHARFSLIARYSFPLSPSSYPRQPHSPVYRHKRHTEKRRRRTYSLSRRRGTTTDKDRMTHDIMGRAACMYIYTR